MKRPRFSLRTLAIVVTLVCAYLAAWEATKRYGCRRLGGTSPMPFFIFQRTVVPLNTAKGIETRDGPTFYYLWLFGITINLPPDE